MKYRRMPIEIESPEQRGYDKVKFNLTESSVTDRHAKTVIGELEDFPLSYGDHLGYVPLREIIAAEYPNISPNNVLTTVGAASALFIVATALLKDGSHAVIQNPNYITNIETPRLLNCDIDLLNLRFETGFKLDLDELESLIRPNTQLISLTYPHNPTGQTLSEDELKQVIAIAEKHNCYLLIDETYRDMQYKTMPPLAASLSDKVISVSSLSKTYGLPGIRSGWLITRSDELFESFLAAKEQIFVTGSLLDEYVSWKFLKDKDRYFAEVKAHLQRNHGIVEAWINKSEHFEWVPPSGGCVAFPRIKHSNIDCDKFYTILNEKYHTYVGPGHWFEQDKRYFRLGYGYPDVAELEEGLANLEQAVKEVV